MIIPTRAITGTAIAALFSRSENLPRAVNPTLATVATNAITALDKSYSKSSLQWTNVTGWIAANAYNDIMDNDLWQSSKKYESFGASLLTIATDPTAQQKVGSTNNFNDDQLWWCLAMIRAYQNYGHQELIVQAAKQWRAIGANAQVFKSDQGTTVKKGGIVRDTAIPKDCDVDGAVYWSSNGDSGLNAISTSLYAQVGAWLLDLTRDQSFRGPTDSALNWLSRMMLDHKTGIMNIDSYTMGGCTKHFGSLTYNTGVYIGALTSMYMTTNDKKYLDQAIQSVTSATTGGFGNAASAPLVIDQEAGLIARSDAVQWRDVLFRNILDFYFSVGSKGAVSADLKGKIQAFFKANYDQIQKNAKFGELYSANWYGKLKEGSDWGTASVLSVLNGAMIIL